MTIHVTIRVDCDDFDDYMGLQHLVLDRYNRVRFTVDMSDHTESAADDEIDPNEVMAILNGARAHAAQGARDVIDRIVATIGPPTELSAPQEPTLLGAELTMRLLEEPMVRADDSGHAAYETKRLVANTSPCPLCKAPAGEGCRSAKGLYKVGGFTHEARIRAFYRDYVGRAR